MYIHHIVITNIDKHILQCSKTNKHGAAFVMQVQHSYMSHLTQSPCLYRVTPRHKIARFTYKMFWFYADCINSKKRKSKMQEYKTLDQAKKVYANESASELALFDYPIIEQLIKWLNDNGRDGSYADYLYEVGSEEVRCLMAEARAEFGLA
tara:strand:+ start:469 stop:921 length:453 start_codon:yes stop_codon:yes gene_type:complete